MSMDTDSSLNDGHLKKPLNIVSEEDLILQCGTPAICKKNKLFLTSVVKDEQKKELQVKTYVARQGPQSKVICNNDSDLAVSVASAKLLEKYDACDNVADVLGTRFQSVTVRCTASGSYQRIPSRKEAIVPDDSPPLETGLVPTDKSGVTDKLTFYRCVTCQHTESTLGALLRHQRTFHASEINAKRQEKTTKQRSIREILSQKEQSVPSLSNVGPPMSAPTHVQPVSNLKPKLVKSNCVTCSSSHILGNYCCRNCSFFSTCPFALERHMRSVHDSQQLYHCPSCAHQHRYYTAMERHLFEKHACSELEDPNQLHVVEPSNTNGDKSTVDSPSMTQVWLPQTATEAGPFHRDPQPIPQYSASHPTQTIVQPMIWNFETSGTNVPTSTLAVLPSGLNDIQPFIGSSSQISSLQPNASVASLCTGPADIGDISQFESTHSKTDINSQSIDETNRLLESLKLLEPPTMNSTNEGINEKILFEKLALCQFCGARYKRIDCHPTGSLEHHLKQHIALLISNQCFLCPESQKENFPSLQIYFEHLQRNHAKNFRNILFPAFVAMQYVNKVPLEPVLRVLSKWSANCEILDKDTYRSLIRDGIQIEVFRRQRLVSRSAATVSHPLNQCCKVACNICGFGPVAKDDIVPHLAAHTHLWPFSCPVCKQCFKQKSLAFAHVSIHGKKAASRLAIRMDDLKKQNEQIVSLLYDKCALFIELEGATVPCTQFPGSVEEFGQFYSINEYWCNMCKYSSNLFQDMPTHMNNHARSLPYICTVCCVSYSSSQSVQDHISRRKCGGNVRFDKLMDVCVRNQNLSRVYDEVIMVEFRLPKDRSMAQRMSKLNFNSIYSGVSITGISSPTQSSSCIDGDVNVHAVETAREPPVEDKSTKYSNMVQTAISIYHFTHQCKLCKQKFKGFGAFKLHAVTHFDLRPWRCPDCRMTFSTCNGMNGFQRHCRTVHDTTRDSQQCVNVNELNKQESAVRSVVIVLNVENVDELTDNEDLATVEDVYDPLQIVSPKPQPSRRKHSFSQAAADVENTDYFETELPAKKFRSAENSEVVAHTIKSNRIKPSGMKNLSYKCPQCDSFKGDWMQLLRHYNVEHWSITICFFCRQASTAKCFSTVEALQLHLDSTHPGKPLPESDCRTAERNLIEQLGAVSRKHYGTFEDVCSLECVLFSVKISEMGGKSCLRFCCRFCSFTSRNSSAFFVHVAEQHLKISEYHCLHCPYEGLMSTMKKHYRKRHNLFAPDILPYSTQNNNYYLLTDKFSEEMKRVSGETLSVQVKEEHDQSNTSSENFPKINIGENNTGQSSEVVRVKQEPLDKGFSEQSSNNTDTYNSGVPPEVDVKTEVIDETIDDVIPSQTQTETGEGTCAWSYKFSCPYCCYLTSCFAECHVHVQTNHCRKAAEVDVEVRCFVTSEVVSTLIHKAGKRGLEVQGSPKKGQVSMFANKLAFIDLPPGFQMFSTPTQALLSKYNSSMQELYYSISPAMRTDSGPSLIVSCHLCPAVRGSFPAMFDHWNYQHVSRKPYKCVYCGSEWKSPTSLTRHTNTAHAIARNHNKFALNQSIYDQLFAELEYQLKLWLKTNKLNSGVQDIKLVLKPIVRLTDVCKDERYQHFLKVKRSVVGRPIRRYRRSLVR